METKGILPQLFNALTKISNPSKNAKNPYFKSSYADLGEVLGCVLKALESEGLTLIQPIQCFDGNNILRTIILSKDSEHVLSSIALSHIEDPQKLGSYITYMRRYALTSAFGLNAVDDDGNHASGRTEAKIDAPKGNLDERIRTALSVLTKGFSADEKVEFLKKHLDVNAFHEITSMKDSEKQEVLDVLNNL